MPPAPAPAPAVAAVPPSNAPPPAAKPPNAPAVPLRARLEQAGNAVRRTVAAIPWQAWRTLAGVVVLGLVWWAIARSCEKPRPTQAEPAPSVRPVASPVRLGPEPYLD